MTILDPAKMLIMRGDFEAQMTPAAFDLAREFIAAVNAKGSGVNHRRMIDLGDDTTESQVRAKVCEILWCTLHGAPIDLDIYDGADGGYDSLHRGWSIEVKRYGTRKLTRGKARFVREVNDLYIHNPPWDWGVVVEDDPHNPTVFRVVGQVARQRWLNQKQFWNGQHPCWYVDRLDPPSAMLTLPERVPSRAWPPGPMVPPALTDIEKVVLDVLRDGAQHDWRRVIARLTTLSPQSVRDALGTLTYRKLILPIRPHRYILADR